MQEYTATQAGPLASLGVHTYAYLPLPAQDRSDVEVIARHLLGVKNIAQSPHVGKLLEQPLKFRDPAADFQGDFDAAKKVCPGEYDLCGIMRGPVPCYPAKNMEWWIPT